MNFNLTRPCRDCPFRREGGIRLHRERAREIAKNTILAQGASFPCHKTVDYDSCSEDGAPLPSDGESYCAGAIAFGLNNRMLNQILRIAQRLGMWKSKDIKDRQQVFGSVSEMVSAQLRQPNRDTKGSAQ